MSSEFPSPREQQILILIHRHISEYDEPPNPKWLAQEFLRLLYSGADIDESNWIRRELKLAHKNVLTIIGRLERKGYIQRQGNILRLTNKALQYFADMQQAVSTAKSFGVIPTQVNLLGHVRAGRVNEYDLDVQVSDIPDEVIFIPEVSAERKIYALRVEGQSMEHEGVVEGDYVIVEEFLPYEWPKNGEMIVTKYLELPEYLKDDPEIDLEQFELSGHTLKYYTEIRERDQSYFRLSWKKDHQSNPHLIKAVRLEPVGRVIGIYRTVR